MKTTLNFPDELISAAKVKAALEHTTLTKIIIEGLELRMRKGDPVRNLPVSQATGGLTDTYRWDSIRHADDGFHR